MDDTTIKLIREKVAEIEAQLEALEKQIKPLIEERQRLYAQKDALLRFLRLEMGKNEVAGVPTVLGTPEEATVAQTTEALMVSEPPPPVKYEPSAEAVETKRKILTGNDLAMLIADILRAKGGMAYYREIYEEIKNRGFEVSGKDPAANVIAHMSIRRDTFESVGRGLWRLKEGKAS